MIHIVLFVLLLSMTAHAAHATVVHETEKCEVCIHMQTNDDWMDEPVKHYLVHDTSLHQKYASEINHSVNFKVLPTDLIRGSPLNT
ncbi:MAG: hypothetical protein ACSHWU_12375 [Marinicella sp.]